MKILQLSNELGLDSKEHSEGLQAYERLRNMYIRQFHAQDKGKYQSPSIDPTTKTQRGQNQNEKEHGVYQRADFTPTHHEEKFNKIFKSIGGIKPKTMFFNSGMAAISVLMFYLKKSRKFKNFSLGENSYFETKWLSNYYSPVRLVNEYSFRIPRQTDLLWIEYPINCTQPESFPFDKQLNIQNLLEEVTKHSTSRGNKNTVLVIDYTLYYISFDFIESIKRLPKNMELFLVTSLQKHRGYGLDLTNGGAITYYSTKDNYEELSKIRTITGSNITQETIWTMPAIDIRIINKLIKDSGKNACQMFNFIQKYKFKGLKFHYSKNKIFKTSFIFVTIDKKLMEKSTKLPFYSDRLISEIIKAASRRKAILVNGTSFGLPFTRIFKNSERYENTNSLRIAVGYDEQMNTNVAESIVEGANSFLKKVS